MKKTIALFLALIFVMSALSACSLFGVPLFGRVRMQPTEPAPTMAAPIPAETAAAVTEAPAPETQAPETAAPIGTLSDYVKTAKEKSVSFGDGNTNILRIPEILLSGTDATAANDEIIEKFGAVVNGDADYTGAYALDYEAYLNQEILSVIVTAKYDGGNSYGLCYSFDVTSGKKLDSEALCTAIGESYSDKLDDLYDELADYYEDKYSTLPGNDTEKEKTYSYSNLKAAVMYLDGSGDLMAMTDIYAAVGGGHWIAQIEVD